MGRTITMLIMTSTKERERMIRPQHHNLGKELTLLIQETMTRSRSEALTLHHLVYKNSSCSSSNLSLVESLRVTKKRELGLVVMISIIIITMMMFLLRHRGVHPVL